jgi:hypothetical protein
LDSKLSEVEENANLSSVAWKWPAICSPFSSKYLYISKRMVGVCSGVGSS